MREKRSYLNQTRRKHIHFFEISSSSLHSHLGILAFVLERVVHLVLGEGDLDINSSFNRHGGLHLHEHD